MSHAAPIIPPHGWLSTKNVDDNNTMLAQIGLLAWLFRGETLTAQMLVGMER